ncbi:MAG: hypothetical protein IAG13_39170 [Deltaproteobacteria bacterium]|nr:hypothetical protein [Nannocystaceae bacterium]
MARTTPRLTLLVAAVLLAACASEPDDTCLTERKLAANRIALNRIALNRIALNGVLGETLPRVALTSESIAEAIEPVALTDAYALDVLEYTVSCALAPGQSVEVVAGGEVLTFEGALGLAPGWGASDGQCDGACERWVSACLIARSNFAGESMEISLVGDRPELEPTAEESQAFDSEEATYFGDLFATPMAIYACLPAGASTAVRTCGEDTAQCPITVLGACDDVCDAAGCRGPDDQVFTETITVNLRDASASCE